MTQRHRRTAIHVEVVGIHDYSDEVIESAFREALSTERGRVAIENDRAGEESAQNRLESEALGKHDEDGQ
jgi:hypothetical protein